MRIAAANCWLDASHQFSADTVQVLEDLEALVKLISSRASDAQLTADTLQEQVTTFKDKAEHASKELATSAKQLDASKKDAAAAKRVCAQFLLTVCCTIGNADHVTFIIEHCSLCRCMLFCVQSIRISAFRQHVP